MSTLKTLGEEVRLVCFDEGNYPEGWAKLPECPCCGQTKALTPSFEKAGIMHAQCRTCGFVCIDPSPPPEILNKLYSGHYYTQIREHYEVPRVREIGAQTAYTAPESVMRDIVERGGRIRSDGTWLDVGGGIGVFANFVKEALPRWKVFLNEMNPRSIELARELFSLDVLPADVSAIERSGQRFDVISAIAVLEHVVDPLGFLQSYAKLLNPGGLLVVNVPHFTRLCAALGKGSNPNVTPPFHCSLFNEDNIKMLFSRCPDLMNISTQQDGPAAFSLIQIAEYGDAWDITMPQEGEPPKSILVQPYSTGLNAALNTLGAANAQLGEDYFADKDGRVFLTVFATKKFEAVPTGEAPPS